MKVGIVAASAALVGSVAAAAHQAHGGFHLRRGGYAEGEICTVYTTVYVTASELPPVVSNTTEIAYPTVVPETTCTTSTSAPPPPPTSKSEYVPAPIPSTSEKPPPAPTSYKEVEKPKPTTPVGSGHYGERIHPNGKKWALTYTPYGNDHLCLSESQIKAGIAKIARLNYAAIRVYSTDCGVFEYVVPAAEAHGLKIIYGIWLDEGKPAGSDLANEQLQDILDNAPKKSFSMLIVGNEYVSIHGGSASALASYVKTVRAKFHAAGFPSDIPVTTTETVAGWEQYGSELCGAIDVFTVQVHPFFDPNTSADEAGEFAYKQLNQAAAVCPSAAAKGKYITEIGWPRGGSANGAAVPGAAEQKKALKSIVEKVGDIACIFSLDDDKWKDPGPYGVEDKFGCSDILGEF